MPSLSETLARLAAAQPRMTASASAATDRLHDVTAFGADPGNLRARCYLPADLPSASPLVVVLHGCTQSAADYDCGSGWSTLAERHGFALLYPEQRAANNASRCFNWFAPDDIARGRGETASIRQMIAHVTDHHSIDPARVFITGLSAGGAMTMTMLATCPEVFAGGAVIAGLPHGTARSVGDALQRMRGIGLPTAAALADLLRAAAPAPPRWPTLSVWHGSADQTVAPANMEAIVAGWAALRGIALDTVQADHVDGQRRRRWTKDGVTAIEAYTIAGLGHGTPIDPDGPDGCGAAMPFMLPAGINSTRHIAAAWGIAEAVARRAEAPRAAILPPLRKAVRAVAPAGVAKTIEDALRAAGLMR